MKALSWLIALLGLWEFGDLAALFVPNFGPIRPFVWSHIVVGLILVIAGIAMARTRNVGMVKIANRIALIAGAWLIIGPVVFGLPLGSAGFWNDVLVGLIVWVLCIWLAIHMPRRTS